MYCSISLRPSHLRYQLYGKNSDGEMRGAYCSIVGMDHHTQCIHSCIVITALDRVTCTSNPVSHAKDHRITCFGFSITISANLNCLTIHYRHPHSSSPIPKLHIPPPLLTNLLMSCTLHRPLRVTWQPTILRLLAHLLGVCSTGRGIDLAGRGLANLSVGLSIWLWGLAAGVGG